MPDMDPASTLQGMDVWIMLFVGFLLAFFGRTFFKAIWFLIGGLMGAVLGLLIGAAIGYLIGQMVMCAAIAALIGFIVGGYMGISWARWLMCLAAAFTGYWIAFAVTGNFLVGIVVAIVFFLIIYIKFDDVLSVMTAIMGGAIVGAVVSGFFGGNVLVLFGVAIPMAILGMYSQIQIDKKWPQHSYKDDRQ